MRKLLIIVMILACLGLASQPALASNDGVFSSPAIYLWIPTFIGSTIAFSALVYYVYKNSPGQRARGYPEDLGPGEWYVGGYTGFSYLPSADWKFDSRFYPPYGGRTAKNIVYRPGPLGGIKFGRFFDTVPWFGIEFETNFSRNILRGGQGRISPPVPGGPANLLGGSDWFMIWAMQTNLIARYGFLKDKEVNFGRLQPYAGIGPGLEIIYARRDAAKNLAIETLAGVRYMCTPKIALFFEYKFSYQFAVEYQNLFVGKVSQGGLNEGTLSFDVPHHRFVIGVSYHFKNLWGN